MKYKLKLDYTEEELKELRELRENHDSPMYAIRRIADIGNGSDKLKNLHIKYAGIDYEDEFDFMADINNVVMGTAIFPEEWYVVHDKFTDRYVCFNTLEETFCWSQIRVPEEKTKEGWLDINPAYESMLERVAD